MKSKLRQTTWVPMKLSLLITNTISESFNRFIPTFVFTVANTKEIHYLFSSIRYITDCNQWPQLTSMWTSCNNPHKGDWHEVITCFSYIMFVSLH